MWTRTLGQGQLPEARREAWNSRPDTLGGPGPADPHLRLLASAHTAFLLLKPFGLSWQRTAGPQDPAPFLSSVPLSRLPPAPTNRLSPGPQAHLRLRAWPRCSLCLKCSPPEPGLSPFFISLASLPKCHLLNGTYPHGLVKNSNLLPNLRLLTPLTLLGPSPTPLSPSNAG